MYVLPFGLPLKIELFFLGIASIYAIYRLKWRHSLLWKEPGNEVKPLSHLIALVKPTWRPATNLKEQSKEQERQEKYAG